MRDERQVLEERLKIAEAEIDGDGMRVGWSLKRIDKVMRSSDSRLEKAAQVAAELQHLEKRLEEHGRHMAVRDTLVEMLAELYGPQHAAESEEVEQ